MIIKKATIDDLPAITIVENICFSETEAATEASLRERLLVYPDHFWLLEDEGILISFIDGPVTEGPDLTDEMFADPKFHDENGKWQMIFGVVTLPEYQNQGYAGKVMRQVIADAKADGRLGLVLTCKDERVHYYASFGFVDEGLSESEHGGAVWHQMRLRFA